VPVELGVQIHRFRGAFLNLELYMLMAGAGEETISSQHIPDKMAVPVVGVAVKAAYKDYTAIRIKAQITATMVVMGLLVDTPEMAVAREMQDKHLPLVLAGVMEKQLQSPDLL
jgi:hypothetical protein